MCRARRRVRSADEVPGCQDGGIDDPNTARFRLEVIKVPLRAPDRRRSSARRASSRICRSRRATRSAARRTQAIARRRLAAAAARGERAQQAAPADGNAARPTGPNQCHDITVYPEIGLAGGACAGLGLLLDISDPAKPGPHRRGGRREHVVLALRDVQQRRHEAAVHRRMGRRRPAALPRDRQAGVGRRTRCSRSRTTS